MSLYRLKRRLLNKLPIPFIYVGAKRADMCSFQWLSTLQNFLLITYMCPVQAAVLSSISVATPNQ
jgi:hypothetical protein